MLSLSLAAPRDSLPNDQRAQSHTRAHGSCRYENRRVLLSRRCLQHEPGDRRFRRGAHQRVIRAGRVCRLGNRDPGQLRCEQRREHHQKQVSQKLRQVVRIDGGTEEREVPAELAGSAALRDDQIALVATTTAEVERQYGLPVDIEFAFDEAGEFFLLQARPVTTL